MNNREIDRLIAEKIFGLRKERVTLDNGKRPTIWHDGEAGGKLKKYSTDISAAWEVVEKIEEKIWGILPAKSHSGKWRVICDVRI